MFSSPSNPTGMLYTKAELDAIAKVIEKNKHVFVMADEIYEYINFESKHESLAQYEKIKERVITINGVSKGYAMTGWRIGYIAASQQIAAACNKIQGQTTSGTCSISQKATIAAMQENPKTSKDIITMQNTFRARRDLVYSKLQEIPNIKFTLPQGAFYFFPEVKYYFGKQYTNNNKITTINNSTDLCNYLLNEFYVATVPGTAFGDDDCIRLSYATSTDKLIEALKRIKEAFSKLK